MGRLKVKGQEKIPCNIDQKKAKVAVLMADKVEVRIKMTRNTEENIVIKASITRRHGIVNVYTLNYKATKYEGEYTRTQRCHYFFSQQPNPDQLGRKHQQEYI